jgi:hypothetical protein
MIRSTTQNTQGALFKTANIRICAESSYRGDKAHAEIWRNLMTVRTSRKSVTFTRPFSLSGIGEVQPAGTYTVETDEELLPGLSFPAYRRLATLMVLRSRGGGPVVEEVANIDPLELQAAQERDAGRHTLADYHSGYLDQSNGLMN